MIRGPHAMATACRRPDGTIAIRTEHITGVLTRYRWLNLPFVRGLPALIEALRLGFRSLFFSAEVQSAGGGTPPLRPVHFALSLAVALLIVLGVFVLLPTAVAQWMLPAGANAFSLNGVESGLRFALLLGYLALIARMSAIQRVFQYHGAEHMTINAFEATRDLTPGTTREFSLIHPRCGTAFLVVFVLIGFLVHLAIGWPSGWWRLGSRLIAIPVIAGLAYEWIRLAGRMPHSRVLRVLGAPGLWAQRLTTRPPDDGQLEVAIASLRACVKADTAQPSPPA